jgi:hypothetical protein
MQGEAGSAKLIKLGLLKWGLSNGRGRTIDYALRPHPAAVRLLALAGPVSTRRLALLQQRGPKQARNLGMFELSPKILRRVCKAQNVVSGATMVYERSICDEMGVLDRFGGVHRVP